MNKIQVRFSTPKDALGRVKPGWYVMDGMQYCGRYETQEEAERQAEALRQIRKVGR